MTRWKLLGLAGLLGVAAVGAVGAVAVKRSRQRKWQDYSPEDLRDRLHARLESSG